MAEGTQLPPQLIKYWTAGEGAAKIRWGSPEGGDFARCKVAIQEAVTKDGKPPLSDHMLSGLCSTLHVIATHGFRPGKAPSEQTH